MCCKKYTDEQYKEAHKKLLNAFLYAFKEFEKQGGKLHDLCWNEFDYILKSMYPNHKDRMVLENRNKAWNVYNNMIEDRKLYND